jgi:hypothetical protein
MSSRIYISKNFVLEVSGCLMSIRSSDGLIYKATFNNETRTLKADLQFHGVHIDNRQTSRINLHLAENETISDLLGILECYWNDLLADIETYP